MAATGALSTILKSIRPVAVKARSMVGDLAQSLKGNRATGEQWYNQLKNVKGVKPSALEAAFGHLKDGRIQLTKDEFLQAVVNPKLSTQRGYYKGEPEDRFLQGVEDLFWVDPRSTQLRQRYMDEWLADNAGHIPNADRVAALQTYTTRGRNHANQQYGINIVRALDDADSAAWEMLQDTPEMERARLEARRIAENAKKAPEFDKYKDFQRQAITNASDPYFETVLRTTPEAGRPLTGLMDDSYHFSNPAQIAHARGALQEDPKYGLSMLVDEIQSDPYQALTENYGAAERAITPQLKTPHGDMAKALLLQAAEGGANRLVIPSGERIANLRGPKYLPAMQDIYDDQLFKQFYKPLDAMGVPTKEQSGYRVLEIPQDVREGLTKSGLPFKNGGQVHQPSKMNNTFMAGGLNLINPKNKTKGPLNIQWNSNNLIATSRAK